MERKLRFMFLATIAVLALLGSSAAQTSHTVGGSLGWIVPPAGESAYTSWARNQSFGVGDTLIFNFPTGAHTVAGVSRADFDACNINNPTFTIRNGPATVALNSTGSHYYICTIPGHCSGGQKLQINVSEATSSSPAPQPASPTPRAPSPAPQPASPAPRAPSPAPQPASPAPRAPSPAPQSAAQTSHTVGGSLGWIVPPAGESAYTSWARNQSFRVGDTLIFNFPTGAHTVAGVSRADFDACNINNPTFTIRNGPATVALNSTGSHYYICTIPGHCSGGQKLQINVSASASSSPAPQPASPTPRAPAPPPAGSPGSSATPPSPSSSVPSAPSPPGPPGSSATSLGVAGVSATLFSLVVAMFFV